MRHHSEIQPHLLAKISGGTTTYYHQDHLSVRLTTDGSGNVATQDGSFPFGESWYQSGPSNNWVFASYDRDSESGLDYALARYYDSRTGTFCSADPLAGSPDDPQSWNRYAYGRNDPIDITDPSGQHWWNWALDIGIGVTLAVLPEVAPAILGGFSAGAGGVYLPATTTAMAGGNLALTSTLVTWGDLATEGIAGGLVGAGVATATHTPQSPQAQAPPIQPKKPCNVSAQSIDKYISQAKPSSPLVGQGANFMATGLKYDLDPRLLVSLAGAESTFGTNITAGQNNALNVMYNKYNSPFSSFKSNINAAGKSLTNPANGYDLSNTTTMYSTYCHGTSCAAGLTNVNRMMNAQKANTNALHYPCARQ